MILGDPFPWSNRKSIPAFLSTWAASTSEHPPKTWMGVDPKDMDPEANFKMITLLGTYISHLGKRKIIFKSTGWSGIWDSSLRSGIFRYHSFHSLNINTMTERVELQSMTAFQNLVAQLGFQSSSPLPAKSVLTHLGVRDVTTKKSIPKYMCSDISSSGWLMVRLVYAKIAL